MVSLDFFCLLVCFCFKKKQLYGMLYCFLRSSIENNDLVFFLLLFLIYIFFWYASLFCVAIYIVQQILISKAGLTVEWLLNHNCLSLLFLHSWWVSTLGTPQWSHGGPRSVGRETTARVSEKSRSFRDPWSTYWNSPVSQGFPCKNSTRYE